MGTDDSGHVIPAAARLDDSHHVGADRVHECRLGAQPQLRVDDQPGVFGGLGDGEADRRVRTQHRRPLQMCVRRIGRRPIDRVEEQRAIQSEPLRERDRHRGAVRQREHPRIDGDLEPGLPCPAAPSPPNTLPIASNAGLHRATAVPSPSP